MNLLRRLENLLTRIERGLIVLLLGLMIALAFLQVALRQGFSSSLLWADTFLRHLVLWVSFLGAAIAAREDKHFAVDLLRKAFPPLVRRASEIVTDLFAVACLWFLARASARFFQDSFEAKSVLFSVGNFEVSAFWMDAVLPGGFFLLLVHFGLKLLLRLGSPLDSPAEPLAPKLP